MQSSETLNRFRRLGRRLAGANRPIVLMYHRIGKPGADPWELSVTTENFVGQIEILKAERDVVPLHWLAEKLRQGRAPRNAVAITFDDGYADVFENGVPILQRFGAPATMFVTTQALGDPTVFWWDVLARIVLETKRLPEHLDIDVREKRFQRQLKEEPNSQRNGETARMMLHFELHAFLKPMAMSDRLMGLEQLAAWAGADAEPRKRDRVMSEGELQQFADTDGLSVGAHTLTHPSLPLLTRDDLHREIAHSRQRCEEIIGRRVTGFAYPFGDCNDATASAVSAAGMDHAVAVNPRAIEPGADLLRIPRIMVADWGESEFRRRVLFHG